LNRLKHSLCFGGSCSRSINLPTPAKEVMSNQAAIIETWFEYGISTIIVTLRMGVRIRKLGLSGLQPDDFLMPLAWV
jgi:hypothetical protein